MEENYFLISVVLLVIFIASLINYYDIKSANINNLTGDFCNDFSEISSKCQCTNESELHNFDTNISNALIAAHLISAYYSSINIECVNPECFDLGSGFYNCFCNEFMGTLRSNGEYYRTECEV